MPSDLPVAPLSGLRPPLATPLLAEAAHEELGEELKRALLPLFVYCETQEAREDLSSWQADRVEEIRHALEALVSYNGQGEELLGYYRAALAKAHDQLTAQVPPLEMALIQAGPDWRGIVFRMLNRLYQHEPGVALACQRIAVHPTALLNWEAIAFRLLDRLHRHEPPGPPSPLVARVRQHLDSPAMQARAALPLDHRRALAPVTSYDLSQGLRTHG